MSICRSFWCHYKKLNPFFVSSHIFNDFKLCFPHTHHFPIIINAKKFEFKTSNKFITKNGRTNERGQNIAKCRTTAGVNSIDRNRIWNIFYQQNKCNSVTSYKYNCAIMMPTAHIDRFGPKVPIGETKNNKFPFSISFHSNRRRISPRQSYHFLWKHKSILKWT